MKYKSDLELQERQEAGRNWKFRWSDGTIPSCEHLDIDFFLPHIYENAMKRDYLSRIFHIIILFPTKWQSQPFQNK